jgi:mannan endo-1,4-beta-mannosidase
MTHFWTHLRILLCCVPGVLFLCVSCNHVPLSINPHASPEVEVLLSELYELSGQRTLSGQHNYLGTISESTEEAHELTGAYPAIWGSDFGFTAAGIDNIYYRIA